AARLAANLETPIDAAEAGDAGSNLLRRHAKLMRDRYRGRSIKRVMPARHMQMERTRNTGRRHDLKMRKTLRIFGKELEPVIGFRQCAVGENAAMHTGQDRRQRRIV